MNTTFCDICGVPIKDTVWFLISINATKFEEYSSSQNLPFNINMMSEKDSNFPIKKLEVCETCKKFIDLIFEERKKGVLKILKEIEKSYKISRGGKRAT